MSTRYTPHVLEPKLITRARYLYLLSPQATTAEQVGFSLILRASENIISGLLLLGLYHLTGDLLTSLCVAVFCYFLLPFLRAATASMSPDVIAVPRYTTRLPEHSFLPVRCLNEYSVLAETARLDALHGRSSKYTARRFHQASWDLAREGLLVPLHTAEGDMLTEILVNREPVTAPLPLAALYESTGAY